MIDREKLEAALAYYNIYGGDGHMGALIEGAKLGLATLPKVKTVTRWMVQHTDSAGRPWISVYDAVDAADRAAEAHRNTRNGATCIAVVSFEQKVPA